MAVDLGRIAKARQDLLDTERQIRELLEAGKDLLVNRYWIIDDDRLLEETVTSVDDLTSFQDQIKALLNSVPSG